MRVILSARAIWVVAKDAEVTEKARAASMMARKSRVEMVICCRGGAKVPSPAMSVGAIVLGTEGSEGTEGKRAIGTGAVVIGAGTKDAGT